ncbi:hypothetical protein EI94DRAFT_1703827 [Lactarius quietus]|nr:hypothetical protein EI94DRAFT_1703827 [Lactarius quietus]
MELMTDVFLTASVLAAVAAGAPAKGRELDDGSKPTTTRVIGIANQCIKESKFGVETKELDDGLEVDGKPISDHMHSVSVHCYDDHCVAMAFSVLGTVVNETVICVEKTWLNWWDDLENKHLLSMLWIGLKVIGVELGQATVNASPEPDEDPSVVIIGILRGGIVKTPDTREILTSYAKDRPIVHVVHPAGEIVAYLEAESSRPAYGEPSLTFTRGASHGSQNVPTTSSLTALPYLPPDENLPLTAHSVRDEVAHFFGHVTGHKANLALKLVWGHRSYFLSLTFPNVTQSLATFKELMAGVDAVELRVDLLCSPGHIDLTVSQGGGFPDKSIKEAFDLFRLALRLGVQYVDIEILWLEKDIRNVIAHKGHARILASWHDWSRNLKWDSPAVDATLEVAKAYGDIVKIVGKANFLDDNLALQRFVERANLAAHAKPIITINIGVNGQLSRVLNTTYTPVTHPLHPSKAAPGQLSFIEIQTTLNLIGELPARKYYIFRNPIAHYMSPTLHNMAFKLLGLPHSYECLKTEDVDHEICFMLTLPDFGGASITIPFKGAIITHLDQHSAEAKAIGAINTVIPHVKGGYQILYGHNTDWIRIQNLVQARLPHSVPTINSALIIGAGGTACAAIYMLHALSATHVYLFNHTRRSAEELAHTIPVLSVPGGGIPERHCVYRAGIVTMTDEGVSNGLFLPSTIFSVEAGVVIDMAYEPAETPLLKLAKTTIPANLTWHTVAGIEVFLEQGYEQFELWTERRCLRSAVAKTVLEVYQTSP